MNRPLCAMLSALGTQTLLLGGLSASAPAPEAASEPPALLQFAGRAERELRDNVLAFWLREVPDRIHGGFIEEISNDLATRRDAVRSSVIATRVLWTFSAAYREYRDPEYLALARTAYAEVTNRFRDKIHGGLFWTITPDGRPLDDRKQVYGQVFGIYALSEFARATGEREPIEHALALHRLLEQHARDRVHGGYFEAFTVDWRRHGSDLDSVIGAPSTKSQNTHLHVMEAYAGLLRAWPDERLRDDLRYLIEVMLGRIFDPATNHLRLYLDDDWSPRSRESSYGHDIEAAWLLTKAADAVGDAELRRRVQDVVLRLAAATLAEGVDADGGIFNEGNATGPTDMNKDWWPQAEAVVGFLNAFQISNDDRYLRAALKSWEFIETRFIDRTHGEWFNSLTRGSEVRPLPKVSAWKGPYHNSRACLEFARRLRAIAGPASPASTATLTLNDLEYLEMPGLNVMLAHDFYPESHQGGVGFIQNGRRVATNGDLRLEPAPGQWQPVPKVGPREIDRVSGEIRVRMEYPDPGKNRRGFNPIVYPDLEFAYTVCVRPEGSAFRIVVDLEEPLPPEWVGRVGFNLELFPGLLFGRTFAIGDTTGIFPRQPNGPGSIDAHGDYGLAPLGRGSRLVVAPESDEQRLVIENLGAGDLQLLDGRARHSNGWFIVRSLVPSATTNRAIEWRVTPHAIPGWKAAPVVQVSQVGYHPKQPKLAVIELDRSDYTRHLARLERIGENGVIESVLEATPQEWGRFLRFDYLQFDFSAITTPGMYAVSYGGQRSKPFRIGADIHQRHVWQPTLEYFLPVQMCHMRVIERYRVWHGCCHLDDARMAPVNHNHFDGYLQGPSTLTRFNSGEAVPGLNRGGWHDAGDFDLRVESQADTIRGLALAYEEFHLTYDNTTIDQENRVVEIHRPDGKPDVLQQIEHGALSIVGGYRSLGRLYRGIIETNLRDYVLLGDPVNHTEARWVFTEENPRRELQVAAGLAAAARALRDFNDPLAADCLEIADKLWRDTHDDTPVFRTAAAVELLLTTGDRRFRNYLRDHRDAICDAIGRTGWMIGRVLAPIDDAAFVRAVEDAVRNHQAEVERMGRKTPYGVPYEPAIWGAGWGIQRFGMEQFHLHKAFPEIVPSTSLFRALDFILGCHPGSNTSSFVSGVGARSLTTAYGLNRADGSHIPGGSGSGTALIRPDFPELLEWPYLWQQTEYVLGGGTTDYLFLVLAADRLLNPGSAPR